MTDGVKEDLLAYLNQGITELLDGARQSETKCPRGALLDLCQATFQSCRCVKDLLKPCPGLQEQLPVSQNLLQALKTVLRDTENLLIMYLLEFCIVSHVNVPSQELGYLHILYLTHQINIPEVYLAESTLWLKSVPLHFVNSKHVHETCDHKASSLT